MGSMLFNAALLGGGFVLGRVPFLPLAAQMLDDLHSLPMSRKMVMTTLVALLVALYVVGMLLPLHWVATREAQKAAKRRKVPKPTSFRRELRRRGSYSVGYVTDIKSHVFACCEDGMYVQDLLASQQSLPGAHATVCLLVIVRRNDIFLRIDPRNLRGYRCCAALSGEYAPHEVMTQLISLLLPRREPTVLKAVKDAGKLLHTIETLDKQHRMQSDKEVSDNYPDHSSHTIQPRI